MRNLRNGFSAPISYAKAGDLVDRQAADKLKDFIQNYCNEPIHDYQTDFPGLFSSLYWECPYKNDPDEYDVFLRKWEEISSDKTFSIDIMYKMRMRLDNSWLYCTRPIIIQSSVKNYPGTFNGIDYDNYVYTQYTL